MQQKSWKKLPYFHLIEKPMARKASLIRAVGKPELGNLQKSFPEAVHIPNGIYQKNLIEIHSSRDSRHFLFLARLHHKKNVLPLVEAWVKINPEIRSDSLLRIAGTNDGEQEKLQEFIRRNPDSGIEFLGPVFGEAKENLMADSMFYILPSLSEGFPTSVVEAAGAGLIPLISKGCNFPELLETGGGIESGTDPLSIQKAMESALRMTESETQEMRLRAQELIKQKFLWELIAKEQADRYDHLLNSQKV
jgi:glycosyltransferase involved in cell wall biosynthesis